MTPQRSILPPACGERVVEGRMRGGSQWGISIAASISGAGKITLDTHGELRVAVSALSLIHRAPALRINVLDPGSGSRHSRSPPGPIV